MFTSLKNALGFGPKVNFKELIDAGALVLDVRSKEEFAGGHARGSVNVPLNQLPSYIRKLKNKQQPIITCCASGMRSGSAKRLLEGEGFTNVHNAGGWHVVARLT
jgi:phage shock protein E